MRSKAALAVLILLLGAIGDLRAAGPDGGAQIYFSIPFAVPGSNTSLARFGLQLGPDGTGNPIRTFRPQTRGPRFTFEMDPFSQNFYLSGMPLGYAEPAAYPDLDAIAPSAGGLADSVPPVPIRTAPEPRRIVERGSYTFVTHQPEPSEAYDWIVDLIALSQLSQGRPETQIALAAADAAPPPPSLETLEPQAGTATPSAGQVAENTAVEGDGASFRRALARWTARFNAPQGAAQAPNSLAQPPIALLPMPSS